MEKISLTDFLCKHGINSTTNFDLMDIAYELDFPLKVLMKDEVSNFLKKDKQIPLIFNYHNSNQKGIHWVAYFKKYYFDSYGLPPLKEIENYVEEYNKLQMQFDDLEYCGQLCIYFLFSLWRWTESNKMYFDQYNRRSPRMKSDFEDLCKLMMKEIAKLL